MDKIIFYIVEGGRSERKRRDREKLEEVSVKKKSGRGVKKKGKRD